MCIVYAHVCVYWYACLKPEIRVGCPYLSLPYALEEKFFTQLEGRQAASKLQNPPLLTSNSTGISDPPDATLTFYRMLGI